MRILLGLKEIAGFYTNLQQGFEELGVHAVFWDLSSHPFQYGAGKPLHWFARTVQFVNGKRNHTPGSRIFYKLWWAGLEKGLRIVLLVWAIARYDVFIFGAKSSFLPGFADLAVLRFFRKRIIYTFHGSDGRPPYVNGADLMADHGRTVEACIRLAARKKQDIRKIERYADVVITHPPYAHFHERRFVTSLSIGNPVRPGGEPTQAANARVGILHSPSNPEAKGTARIRRAVERLRERGYEFDYVEITGQPNAVVIRELQRTDIVVDQLYSYAPLASFATEASFLGKPAVVGGYVTSDDLGVPADLVPPCEFCRPEEVEDRIEALILNPERRVAAAMRARQFVMKNWAPVEVARRMLRVVRGDIPDDWWFDPQDIRYLHGCCVSEEHARQAVRRVVEKGGVEVLQLGDKAALQRAFVVWAMGAEAECFVSS